MTATRHQFPRGDGASAPIHPKKRRAGTRPAVPCAAILALFAFAFAPSFAQSLADVEKRIAAHDCGGLVSALSAKAEGGDKVAQRQLGVMYANACGVPPDMFAAVKWTSLAARQGDPQAQENLADLTQHGLGGLQKDYAEALRLFKLAAQSGSAFSQNRIGFLLNNGWPGNSPNSGEAALWFRKAADQGLAEAMFNLANLYENGGTGFEKSLASAVPWYRRASDLGLTPAMARLARLYVLGLGGVAQDLKQGVDLYRKAAEAGDREAEVSLGYIYQTGMVDFPSNPDKAAYWYGKAADQGDQIALFNLGRMKWLGEGSNEDRTEAMTYFRRSAEQGNAAALNAIGIAYAHGEGGVVKDIATARRYFQRSADLGNDPAKKNLRELDYYVRSRNSAQAPRFTFGGPSATNRWHSTVPSYNDQYMMNRNGGPGSRCYAGSAFNQGCR